LRSNGEASAVRRVGYVAYALHLWTVFGLALSNLAGVVTLASVATLRPKLDGRARSVLLPAGLFCVCVLLSVVFSNDPRASMSGARGLLSLLTLPFGLILVRGRKQSRAVVDGLIVMATFAALWGLIQLLFGYGGIDQRIRGPFSHWMTFAGVLLIADMLLLAQLVSGREVERAWRWAALLAINLGLLACLTRGAWIAGAVGALVVLLLRAPRWLALIGPALALVLVLAPTPVRDRMTSIVDLSNFSNYDRLCMLEAGWRMARERPVFGHGPDMVRERYPIYRHPTAPRHWVPHLHNNLVQIAAENGLVAAATFFWLMVAATWAAYRGFRAQRRASEIVQVVGVPEQKDVVSGVPDGGLDLRPLVHAIVFDNVDRGAAVDSLHDCAAVLSARGGRSMSSEPMRGGPANRAFVDFSRSLRPEVEAVLAELLPAVTSEPEVLHEAMRYSVFAGGKRVRPALLVLAGETYGLPRETLLPGAAALEMVHTFSLVHDDLPALDDDDLRRGQPTVHKRFDEATAVLVGDALLNLGLQTLMTRPEAVAPDRRLRAATLVAEAVGTSGMIGGQMADLDAENDWPQAPEAALEAIHRRKTGALLTAALRVGGAYGALDEESDALLNDLGRCLGLMFQIGDDVLDVEGDSLTLGKTAGKDESARKLTYPSLYGLEASHAMLQQARTEALALVDRLPAAHEVFASLVDYLCDRDR
jgi:geranylgeranyl pyrophosphate synthase/O-antigen ligase